MALRSRPLRPFMETHPAYQYRQAMGTVVKDLIIRLSQGDQRAFTPLFELLWPVVLKYFQHFAICLDDAEDAAQEVLLKVFHERTRFNPTKNGIAWVLSIARFEALTFRQSRRRRKEESFEELSWVEGTEPAGEDVILQREIRHSLARAVEQLSSRDRAIWQDLVGDDLGTRVPADACARKRKQRVLERLEVAWRKFDS